MDDLADLGALEKSAFRKFYDDGLFDVFFGLMMVTMSVGAVAQDWLGSEAWSLLFMAGIAVVLVGSLLTVRVRLLRSRLGNRAMATQALTPHVHSCPLVSTPSWISLPA